jgi:transcription antitermination factor NusG
LNWFALYTNPRAEKRAYAELVRKGITAYLPLQRILKLWSDRKKWVEEPLFRSYMFVRVNEKDYYEALNTPGIVRYITFEGRAVPVPQQQIDAIRYYLSEEDQPVEAFPGLSPGQAVEVMKGPLRGLCGELVEIAGRHKVKVEIEAIGQSITVTIPQSHLKNLGG